MVIEHNGVSHQDETVTKDFNGARGLIYAMTAQTFSRFAQYPIFGERFFEWPLAMTADARAEREWIYQYTIADVLNDVGHEIDGVAIHAVEFDQLEDHTIVMERLQNHDSLFELLADLDDIAPDQQATLGKSIEAYGTWTATLYNRGIVAECNHCGNVMVDRDNLNNLTLIDFENYSGPVKDSDPEVQEYIAARHRMLGPNSVDPIRSLALDIGILAGLKLPYDSKSFYIVNFLQGLARTYEGSMDDLLPLLFDPRVRYLGLIRAGFYDSTHRHELKTGKSAISYFREAYDELCLKVAEGLEEITPKLPAN